MNPIDGGGSGTGRDDEKPAQTSTGYSVSVRGGLPPDIGHRLAEAHIQVLKAQSQPPSLMMDHPAVCQNAPD